MNCLKTGQEYLTTNLSSPDSNHIELIVFGKGVGECVLIKSKNGDYIVIDSFIDNRTGNPVVLDYLDKFNIPYSNIKMIIITHWHTDHIEGVSKIIEAIEGQVKVVINPIIKEKRYLDFLTRQTIKENNDIGEFFKVLNLIKNGKIKKIIPVADITLYASDLKDLKLIALSPQNSDLGDYIDSLLDEKLPKNDNFRIPDDNLLSIVVLLEFNGNSILLSGDMENRKNGGWNEIIKNYLKIYPKSKIYKVPHHGSVTGENPLIWNNLLDDPISLTTLYNRSYLPKDEDIERIVSNSKEVYVIGDKGRHIDELEREFKKQSINKEFLALSNKIGFVRIILNDSFDHNVETIGSVRKYWL